MGEAISQVKLGRLIEPIPIGNSGRAPVFSLEGANSPFRIGVGKNDKLGARGELKQNMVNLRTSVYTRSQHGAIFPRCLSISAILRSHGDFARSIIRKSTDNFFSIRSTWI